MGVYEQVTNFKDIFSGLLFVNVNQKRWFTILLAESCQLNSEMFVS